MLQGGGGDKSSADITNRSDRKYCEGQQRRGRQPPGLHSAHCTVAQTGRLLACSRTIGMRDARVTTTVELCPRRLRLVIVARATLAVVVRIRKEPHPSPFFPDSLTSLCRCSNLLPETQEEKERTINTDDSSAPSGWCHRLHPGSRRGGRDGPALRGGFVEVCREGQNRREAKSREDWGERQQQIVRGAHSPPCGPWTIPGKTPNAETPVFCRGMITAGRDAEAGIRRSSASGRDDNDGRMRNDDFFPLRV